tara:strand:+ start:207 stop:2669 length:2463 start_codon:yes stop_codon:yes gene_type:complete
MTFKNCIDEGVQSGEITQDQASEINSMFDDLEVQYNRQMGGAAATAKAAADTSIAAKKIAIERKRRAALQAVTWKEINYNLNNYRTITGKADKSVGALALFEQDQTSRFNSVAQVQQAVTRSATRKLDEFLSTFRRNIIGETKKKAQLKNLVREVFGEETGDVSAREMMQAWKASSEYLRTRFNAAGGAIAKRADWGMPQIHDTMRVRQSSYNDWRDFIHARLDITKMIDEQTGLTFSGPKLEMALRDSYETITKNGFNKIKPGTMTGNKSLALRNQDHRFFVFKNADSWMDYQEKFGNPNPFDAMMGHIDTMSRDIAMMEVLGPNPRATVNFIKQTLQKDASGNDVAERAARRSSSSIDALYAATTGSMNAPVDSKFAYTFAGIRQVLQSAQLGAAAISAVTDMNFGRIARSMVGLPQTKMIQNYLKFLNPLSLEEKGKLAVRLGLTAEGWSTLAAAQMRYVGDLSGPEVTRRVADFVMRASLLSPWTNAGKWAFGMEFLGNLADNAGKSFDQLDPMMRKTLDHYGIGEAKWETVRATPLYEYEGASFLRAEDIEARTDLQPELARDLATSLLVMVETETNFAVPSSSIRGRTALTGDTRPGTIAGELTRSFAMYKNFGVTLVNTHIMRGLNQPTQKAKGTYFADLLISTTIMGALAMQLKEMSKGRDPRPMEGPEFWGAAFLQGGGLGIYGDFLFSDVNRYDRGLAETIAGPVVGFADDVRKLTIGNVTQAIKGEDTNAASEFINFAARYTPGSSLWYSRLALERMVIDQSKMWVDPSTKTKMKRLESRYKRENGQNYWWRPGKVTPERAPDVSNVFE